MPVINATSIPTSVPTVEPSLSAGQPFQNIQASAGAFGGAVAQGLGELGQAFGQAGNELAAEALHRQQLFNQVAADDATNKYMDAETKLLYGDPDKPGDVGFFGAKGEDAMRMLPQVRDQLLKLRGDLRNGLQNPRQQLQFDTETRRMQALTLARMGEHYDRQFATYSTHVADAKIANANTLLTQAVADDNSETATLAVKQRMEGELEKLRVNGLSNNPDAVNAALQKVRGDYVKVRVETLSQKNPYAALQYLDQNKDSLSGDEYNQLHRTYRAQASAIQAQVNAGLIPAPNGSGDFKNPFGAPHSGGWGSLAAPAIETFKKAGASQAFIEAALASGLAEGGFKDEWQKAWGKEESYGHWQFHQGAELDEFEKRFKGDRSTTAQAKFLVDRMEEEVPGITKSNNAEAILDAISTKFERYKGNAPGQRRGYLAEARKRLGAEQPAAQASAFDPNVWAAQHQIPIGLDEKGALVPMGKDGKPIYDAPGYDYSNTGTKVTPQAASTAPVNVGQVAAAERLGAVPSGSTVAVMEAAPQAALVSSNGNQPAPPPQSAAEAADTLIRPQPLPKLDFVPPPVDGWELPDDKVPGMAQAYKHIMETVPADDVVARYNAVKAARQFYNQQYMDRQRALREHNELVKQQSEKRFDQFTSKIYPGSQELPTPEQIAKDEYMTGEKKQTLQGFLNRTLTQPELPPARDKANAVALFAGMNAPYESGERITTEGPFEQAFIHRQISKPSYDWLIKEFRNQRGSGNETLKEKKKELLDAVKPLIIGPKLGEGSELMDPEGSTRYFNYINYMNSKIDQYQKEGKNPLDLFNSKSPDFLGDREALKKSGYIAPIFSRVTKGAEAALPPVDLTAMSEEQLKTFGRASPKNYDAALQEAIRRGLVAPAQPALAPPVR